MWIQLRKAEICSFHPMMLSGASKPEKAQLPLAHFMGL